MSLMNMHKRFTTRGEAGDTLVEVLLATVLLSVVLAGAYTLSNRASRINQQAFERTQISNFMQEQVELARAARDSYNAHNPATQPWNNIISRAQNNVPDLGTGCNDLSTVAATRSNEFHINQDQTVTNGIEIINGLSIGYTEVERGTDSDYWDIHVFGCWEAYGPNPTNITSVVLRLADPS